MVGCGQWVTLMSTSGNGSAYPLHFAPSTLPPRAVGHVHVYQRERVCLPRTLYPQALYPLHPTPYTLHPEPYTLHPSPYTLHLTPYTLHPAPYTLHPTCYTSGNGSEPNPAGGRFRGQIVGRIDGQTDRNQIRKEAWPFHRTSSGVRLWWELDEPKSP